MGPVPRTTAVPPCLGPGRARQERRGSPSLLNDARLSSNVRENLPAPPHPTPDEKTTTPRHAVRQRNGDTAVAAGIAASHFNALVMRTLVIAGETHRGARGRKGLAARMNILAGPDDSAR